MIVTPVAELIDTLWNVNYLPSVSNFEPIARINRYIMECKCTCPSSAFAMCWRINRYIMECK